MDDVNFDMFEIDMTRLDEEWVNQPKMYFKFAEQLAGARKTYEQKKASANVVEAETALDIKQNHKKYGFTSKPTVDDVKNKVQTITAVKKANKSVIISKHRVDMIQAAVIALDHRKSALERLVSLHGQNYFSTPQAKDPNSRETVHNIKKKVARRKKRRSSK